MVVLVVLPKINSHPVHRPTLRDLRGPGGDVNVANLLQTLDSAISKGLQVRVNIYTREDTHMEPEHGQIGRLVSSTAQWFSGSM